MLTQWVSILTLPALLWPPALLRQRLTLTLALLLPRLLHCLHPRQAHLSIFQTIIAQSLEPSGSMSTQIPPALELQQDQFSSQAVYALPLASTGTKSNAPSLITP